MKFAGSWIFEWRLFDVNQINEALTGNRAGAAIAAIAIFCGTIGVSPVSPAWSAPTCQFQHQLAAERATPASPDENGDDDKDVPTSQVDKYISVYEAMQKDHNLTVEQAASKQGLTVAQFRALEGRIERDDTLRERVRKALRHEVNPNDKESSD
jgi:hypothetical protein